MGAQRLVSSPDRLPNWPPHDGEPIGVDRARASIARVKQHAGPVLEEAEQLLQARYPGAVVHRPGCTVQQLATCSLSPTMMGLAIGCVACDTVDGSLALVDIVITREGHLVAQPGMNMRD